MLVPASLITWLLECSAPLQFNCSTLQNKLWLDPPTTEFEMGASETSFASSDTGLAYTILPRFLNMPYFLFPIEETLNGMHILHRLQNKGKPSIFKVMQQIFRGTCEVVLIYGTHVTRPRVR